jgi:hypothetical protein
MIYSLRLPEGCRLRFAVGIPENAWSQGSDGVEFRMEIRSEGGEWREIYTRYLNPRGVATDRGWQRGDVHLAPWGGQSVEIRFLTGPGPRGDTSFDWAFWADPHLRTGKD